VIKASDFTDNAVRVIHLTGPKLSRLARKCSPLVPVLPELILRPDTPLDADVKTMIAAQTVISIRASGPTPDVMMEVDADNGLAFVRRPNCWPP
jgi:hypothetical protein